MKPPPDTDAPSIDPELKKGKKGKKGKKKPKSRRAGETARKGLPVDAVAAWQKRMKQLHPDVAALLNVLPPRIYECERSGAPFRDGLGFAVPVANPLINERLIEVLRVLGRMYVSNVDSLHRMLYYRRFDVRTTYRDLAILAKQRLIWKVPAYPGGSQENKNKRPIKPINVYGLSRAGHQLLADLGVESDDKTLDLLVKRDVSGQASNPSVLGHDLQVSWWCMSMIEGLQLIPWCTGIWCQAEYRSSESQRIDALIVARFDFSHPRQELQQIPWFAGSPRREGEVELRWALELDNSTESVGVLVNKFITYRDYHLQGHYERVLGGDVMLVLVVQNQNRAAYLAGEFRTVWPGGWGVVSTPELANTTPFGALWGTYLHMYSDPDHPRAIPLLSAMVREVNREEGYMDVGDVPLLTYAQWRAYLKYLIAGNPPLSRGELNRRMEKKDKSA